MAKKKLSRNLVPVGTHVEASTKLGLQALAESQNSSIYAVVQELIENAVSEYEEELAALKGTKGSKKKETPTDTDDDSLLG